mmetsp:Transcript_24733/g.38157  ORF Transcript_24733/g.38157 Transcript_24733/m.38157 type:complete len:216 (-) Transcript_24733:51-698(-)
MMMKNTLIGLVVAALCMTLSSGFVAPHQQHQPFRKTTSSITELHMGNKMKQAVATFVASSMLLSNVIAGSDALAAADPFLDGPQTVDSSLLIAARSGGRAGGRSSRGMSSPRMSSPGGSRRAAPSYRSTTIIAPARPVISSPIYVSPFGYSPFSYNPFGGFGLGYGLGSMNNARDTARDYRQESEIQQTKAELETAKAKEAELEQRIKELETIKK